VVNPFIAMILLGISVLSKDIADYLIKLDWHKFREKEITINLRITIKKDNGKTIKSIADILKPVEINGSTFYEKQEKNTFNQEKEAANWDNEIDELESFFKNLKLPKEEIKLNQCTTISNLNKFIKSHLSAVKANNGNEAYLPYLVRLYELKCTA
jgi:L-serine deaminase